MRLGCFYGGLDAAQEVVGTGEGLVVVQANLVQEFLSLQSEGAWSGSACLSGGIQGGAAICDVTVGVVVYFSSFRWACVHVHVMVG